MSINYKLFNLKSVSFFVILMAFILSISYYTEEYEPSERFTLLTTPFGNMIVFWLKEKMPAVQSKY
jgi:uncharacterized membrane protein